MSIFIVSGVMHRADGASKLVHGSIEKETSEAAMGFMTNQWLNTYKGYALEQILCSPLPESPLKSEGSQLSSSEGIENETNTGNETKTE